MEKARFFNGDRQIKVIEARDLSVTGMKGFIKATCIVKLMDVWLK